MNEVVALVPVSELAEGEMRRVEAEDHEFLVALIGGQPYVADARCPHLHALLTDGVLEATVVTCPRHGSQFDLTDGRCVRWTEFSGVVRSVAEFVRHPRPLRVYEAFVEDGVVTVGPQKEPVRG